MLGRTLFRAAVVFAGLLACGSGAAGTPPGQPAGTPAFRVFAAASLADAIGELAAFYERRTGERVAINFAASSVLARQIELGAPADVFLSADEAKMDALQRRGLIDPATRVSVLSNTLVVVGENIRTPRDLIGKRVALAEPTSVPAGIYARTWLTSIGLWNRIDVIPTENVRGALSAVKAGHVDAAIVYKTDTRKYAFEVKNGPPISYPFAAVCRCGDGLQPVPARAKRFLNFLRSPYARRVFAKHGFIVR